MFIPTSVFLFSITKKYGMNEKKRSRVKGNGNGVNEMPVKIPDKIRRSLSFLKEDFSDSDNLLLRNSFTNFNSEIFSYACL